MNSAEIKPFVQQVTLALPPWVGQGLSLAIFVQTLARGQDYLNPNLPPAETLDYLNVRLMGWLLVVSSFMVLGGLILWILRRWAVPLMVGHAAVLLIYGFLFVGIAEVGWHADHYWRSLAQVAGGGFVNVVLVYGLNRARQLQKVQAA